MGARARVDQLGDGLVQRRLAVLEVERHRALGAAHSATSRPVSVVSLCSMASMSPSVADISRKVVFAQAEQRDLPGDAALAVGVVVELVHHHVVDARRARSRSARLARISAVQQRIGASRLIAGVAGHHAHVLGAEGLRRASKNFSLTSALIGQV